MTTNYSQNNNNGYGKKRRDFRFNEEYLRKSGGNVEFYDGFQCINNLGAGDSYYIPNFIKDDKEKERIMSKLLEEVKFEQMFSFVKKNRGRGNKGNKGNNEKRELEPIPRLVKAQTDKDESKIDKYPVYRMPGCNQGNIPSSNWTKTVELIRKKASSLIGQEFNHCVCTLYKDNNDSLGFHKDKLLDLKDKSLILSLTFGAARPILFYQSVDTNRGENIYKNSKHKQCIILQPGSLLAIGQNTNIKYMHCIPKVDEKCGPRISLSMRTIDTFHSLKDNKIIGKGEQYQTLNWPFCRNYSNPQKYDQETYVKMEKYKQESQINFNNLKKEYSKNHK